MKNAAGKAWRYAQRVAANPVIRPAEIWAVRVLLAYTAVHFGLKV